MAFRSIMRRFERMNWHPGLLLRPLRGRPFRVADSGESIRARLDRLAGRGAPLWTITSYERPGSCARLVESLAGTARAKGLEPNVVVIRDAGASDYTEVREALARAFGERGVLIEATRHLAKPGFWQTHQLIMDLVRALDPPHHLALQDDIELAPGWHDEMGSIVEAIDDPDLAALYLLAVEDDEPEGRWIEFERVPSGDGRARLTQWLDLQAYLALPRMYEALAWRMLPVARSRWRKNPDKSSGVGQQITSRLFARRANVHQVAKTLVYHGGHESLMNPGARAERPLDNRPKG